MSDRPSNRDLCHAFRKLLTDGFQFDAAIYPTDGALAATKVWRGRLWTAFNELEERLDPIGVETRRRKKAEKNAADG